MTAKLAPTSATAATAAAPSRTANAATPATTDQDPKDPPAKRRKPARAGTHASRPFSPTVNASPMGSGRRKSNTYAMAVSEIQLASKIIGKHTILLNATGKNLKK
jgi:hypothetical protein